MLADALFLLANPGWSWQDLQSAPDEVVQVLRLARHKIAQQQRTG